jgi:leucyl-tRNA synthetase
MIKTLFYLSAIELAICALSFSIHNHAILASLKAPAKQRKLNLFGVNSAQKKNKQKKLAMMLLRSLSMREN